MRSYPLRPNRGQTSLRPPRAGDMEQQSVHFKRPPLTTIDFRRPMAPPRMLQQFEAPTPRPLGSRFLQRGSGNLFQLYSQQNTQMYPPMRMANTTLGQQQQQGSRLPPPASSFARGGNLAHHRHFLPPSNVLNRLGDGVRPSGSFSYQYNLGGGGGASVDVRQMAEGQQMLPPVKHKPSQRYADASSSAGKPTVSDGARAKVNEELRDGRHGHRWRDPAHLQKQKKRYFGKLRRPKASSAAQSSTQQRDTGSRPRGSRMKGRGGSGRSHQKAREGGRQRLSSTSGGLPPPIYGNFKHQQSIEHNRTDRMDILLPDWYSDMDVLDIGCNDGVFTLRIAETFNMKSMTGVDIDSELVDRAKSNHASMVTRRKQKAAMYTDWEGLMEDFLGNVKFVSENYVAENIVPNENTYDVIQAFSLTKWIHLNWGDEGIQRLFRRVFTELKPGGKFIFEPQPFSGYKRAMKCTKHRENFARMVLNPEDFQRVLSSIGFVHILRIESRYDNSGFQRNIRLCSKPSGMTPAPATTISLDAPVVGGARLNTNHPDAALAMNIMRSSHTLSAVDTTRSPNSPQSVDSVQSPLFIYPIQGTDALDEAAMRKIQTVEQKVLEWRKLQRHENLQHHLQSQSADSAAAMSDPCEYSAAASSEPNDPLIIRFSRDILSKPYCDYSDSDNTSSVSASDSQMSDDEGDDNEAYDAYIRASASNDDDGSTITTSSGEEEERLEEGDDVVMDDAVFQSEAPVVISDDEGQEQGTTPHNTDGNAIFSDSDTADVDTTLGNNSPVAENDDLLRVLPVRAEIEMPTDGPVVAGVNVCESPATKVLVSENDDVPVELTPVTASDTALVAEPVVLHEFPSIGPDVSIAEVGVLHELSTTESERLSVAENVASSDLSPTVSDNVVADESDVSRESPGALDDCVPVTSGE